MSFSIPELVLLAVAALLFAALVFLVSRLMMLSRQQADLAVRVTDLLEAKHLAMLKDVNDGLNTLGDRLAAAEADNVERLRAAVETQLRQTREAMVAIQLSQSQDMATNREQLLERVAEVRTDMLGKTLAALGEQGKVQAETLQDSVRGLSQQLTASIETLTRAVDARLEQIQGKVAERLEEGFRKTNETFVSVMERLATIDEAQRKIDGLTTNVVSLQELLGDKRSRGAYGEVQLEALVRNILPPSAYAFQAKLGEEQRVADCLLQLPEPTGIVAVDAKFPMENYHRMFEPGLGEVERATAQRLFRADLRKHVDDIANRYIIPGETSDGAVMFIPAEAVFAEIHAYHAEVVDYAMQRHVWIVSPTTMMAVLNTARAVIKDVETRRQVHVIKDELGKLGKDFGRFEERMRKLANHIRQAHQDAEEVRISSDKIVRRFGQIEKVELDAPADVQRLEQVIAAGGVEADDDYEAGADAEPRLAEGGGG
jgi:DNA recombination protein RmuC